MVGEVSVGEVSVGDLSTGKCQSGNCPVGKLSYNRWKLLKLNKGSSILYVGTYYEKLTFVTPLYVRVRIIITA